MGKSKATGLYTSKTGVIACVEHAPPAGTEVATSEGWKPLTQADAKRYETEVGRAPACETCAAAPAVDAPAADAPEVKPRKAKKAKATDITLEDLAERYLAHLDEVGKSQGTLFSYKLELVTALDELGAKTMIGDLTPTRVLEFFVSDRVMKTRTGVAKARPTYEKTRRVLRQALVFAEQTKLVAKAPLPEDAATH